MLGIIFKGGEHNCGLSFWCWIGVKYSTNGVYGESGGNGGNVKAGGGGVFICCGGGGGVSIWLSISISTPTKKKI